jgi:hypothetical protein
MVTPPPNLMQGIYLAQTGHKVEALAYLRHAARTESIGTEGWLWLAAATDDLEEYRYCVQMALQLDPIHAVALRMRDELARRGIPVEPLPGNGTGRLDHAVGDLPRGSTQRRRIVLAVIVLLLVAAFIVAAYVITVTDILEDAVDEVDQALSGSETTLSIGSAPGFRFSVDLPESWLAADEDSADWQAARAALEEANGGDVWGRVDESFSAVTRDPVYGGVQPPARLVNTDQEALAREGVVATLALHAIKPLPEVEAGEEPTVCNRMVALQHDLEGSLASGESQQTLASGVIERDLPDDCVFFMQTRTNPAGGQDVFLVGPEPDTVRSVAVAVPVGAGRYALWWMTFADEASSGYQDTLDQVLDSLKYIPES